MVSEPRDASSPRLFVVLRMSRALVPAIAHFSRSFIVGLLGGSISSRPILPGPELATWLH